MDTAHVDVQWLDDEERAAWLTFARTSVRLADQLEGELLARHGLLLADYELLVILSHAGCEGLRMSDLADRALISRSRLTHRVNRMEQEGLVTRRSCRTDRRGAFAVITVEGRARLVAAAPTHVDGLRRYLTEPLTRSELAALTATLRKVLRALGDGEIPQVPPGIGC